MSELLVVSIAIAALFLVGQWYLRTRRRKARRLFDQLARCLGVAGRGARIDLMVGSHRVVLDAQVTRDDRPEELRLTLASNRIGDLRLTQPAAASHYEDCKHREPAAEGAPFSGWHAHSEDPELLVALASDRRIRESLARLAALGFPRVELAGARLRALWPDFPWEPDQHRFDAADTDSLPSRVRRAAAALSELATAAETALRSAGHALRGPRVRATLAALVVLPLLLMVAAAPASWLLYDVYPTLRDAELLAAMLLAGTALSAIYTAIAHRLLRDAVQRGARTAAVGLVSLSGLCLASSAPILWWNGAGLQGPGQRVTVEVVKLDEDSALDSGLRGRLLRGLVGEDSPIDEWATTRRAIVRSWRDDRLYAVTLDEEQFSALAPERGRLSLTVFPGALGLEWYSDVVALASAELP